MSRGDSARIHEEMARWELIQRIEHRDNTLLLFLGAVGAIFAALGTDRFDNKILLVIPYLALGVVFITEHHNKMIGLLGRYLKLELEPYYRKIKEYAPQWDGSSSNLERSTEYPITRKIGHLVLIIGPSAFSLMLNLGLVISWGWVKNPKLSLVDQTMEAVWRLLWLSSGVCILLSGLHICRTDDFRAELYSEYREAAAEELDSLDMDSRSHESTRRPSDKSYGFLGIFWHRD
jgi:hypothetical protein